MQETADTAQIAMTDNAGNWIPNQNVHITLTIAGTHGNMRLTCAAWWFIPRSFVWTVHLISRLQCRFACARCAGRWHFAFGRRNPHGHLDPRGGGS